MSGGPTPADPRAPVTAPGADSGDDLPGEQQYLNEAERHLVAMSQRAALAAEDARQRAKADWNAAVAHARLVDRVASLSAAAGPLCFGRIDEDGGPRWYIGRRHVENASGEPVVVDWRASVAVPFYRATYRDPLGLDLRRRFILEENLLVDLLDENFAHPEAGLLAAAAGLPDPLLAQLGRARTGPMRDIVATIAAEQDLIIRAGLDVPLVVQGGPGTGKTAVGLHRAAFLLYEHRAALARHGVLVLGPNRRFLAYISEVLPSLGEVDVVQTTIPGLMASVPVRGEDASAVDRLKGDPRLAEVIARAATDGIHPPEEDLLAVTRWGAARLHPDAVAGLLEEALGSGGSAVQRRTRFRRAVARALAAELSTNTAPTVISPDEVQRELRADRRFERELERAWPARSAPALVRALLSRPSLLRRVAAGVLSADEMGLLSRRSAPSMSSEPWTPADLVLIDEAESHLGEAPRRYGHVVVDEAQDLSAMAWRMVARRSADGRSFTILGDLAQATAPAAQRDWQSVIDALGRPAGATVARLSVGYRVPKPIMDYANRLLPEVHPDLPVTESVRPWGEPPQLEKVSAHSLLAGAAAAAATRLLGSWASVAVIAPGVLGPELTRAAPDHPGLTLLEPPEAKGLEFDAVVVVEPRAVYESYGGPGLLYIALTRAVQELVIVHHADLPGCLTAQAAA